MKFKFFIAMALFVSSVSFEQQVLQTQHGVDSNWTVSIQVTNEAFAREMAMEMQNFQLKEKLFQREGPNSGLSHFFPCKTEKSS